ncbi:MAG: 5-formyltetrahydrofolate cyclo-ligase [Deltaproteobacteria bacterium]|nr:5-formyltetrahydrofolate cyclo-ligase [Deltaproteobacteria bacterium]
MRGSLLKTRLRLSFGEVYEKSLDIERRFINMQDYKRAMGIALYASFKNEVLTDEIFLDAVEEGKQVFYPTVIKDRKGLGFVKVNGRDDLMTGSYDILEPGGKGVMDRPPVNLVVVPGVAFDMMGNRLGYGKGYYDRALVGLKGQAGFIALAFDFQIVESIPTQPHDVRVGWIITEKRTIKCKL